MTASDSNMGFRQRLLETINRSGVSDRRLSLVATGSADTIRNMRRGSSPRLDSLEALCRVLGLRLQIAHLDESDQVPEGGAAMEKRPEWSRRLREEIRHDLVEILGRASKGANSRTDQGRTTGEKEKNQGYCRSSIPEKT